MAKKNTTKKQASTQAYVTIAGRHYQWDHTPDGAVVAALHANDGTGKGPRVSVIWSDAEPERYHLSPYKGPIIEGNSIDALKEQAETLEAQRLEELAAE